MTKIIFNFILVLGLLFCFKLFMANYYFHKRPITIKNLNSAAYWFDTSPIETARAKVFISKKDYVSADKAIQKAIKLNPTSREARGVAEEILLLSQPNR